MPDTNVFPAAGNKEGMSAFWSREVPKSPGLQAMVPGSPYFGCMTLKSAFYDITKKADNS